MVSDNGNQGKDPRLPKTVKTASELGLIEKACRIAARGGVNAFECSENISVFLGDVISSICKEFKPGGLVLTGGDIAIKVIKAMGISGTVIKDEVLPGVASGHFISDELKNITFVTKAGAFGKKDALVKIIDFLKKT